MEEIEVLTPAIEDATPGGLDVAGPFPPTPYFRERWAANSTAS